MHAIPTARRLSAQSREHDADLMADAFADLYRLHGARVHAFLRYRLADAGLAEDLTAEVFARAWSNVGRWRSPEASVAWLFTTARHLVADHYRRRRVSLPLDELPFELHPVAQSPEEGVLTAERLASVDRCLAELGERERDVIGLRFAAGLRNGEIARVLGISEGNVAKIIHRALRKLRERLSTEGTDDV